MAKNTSTRSDGGPARTPAGSKSAPVARTRERVRRDGEARRVRRDAEADAARIRAEAEDHARRLVLDARASADGVRAEGMELVSNLREMSDALRANAERLLEDIQSIHTRMVGELEQVDPGVAEDGGRAEDPTGPEESGPPDGSARDGEEVLDVPDFLSRG